MSLTETRTGSAEKESCGGQRIDIAQNLVLQASPPGLETKFADECGMDSALVNRFAETGYVGPIQVLNRKHCQRLKKALCEDSGDPLDWSKGCAISSAPFFELATRKSILDMVARFIGPDIMLWGASLVCREPGQVHPWHTDIETADPSSRAVSVWIGLDLKEANVFR